MPARHSALIRRRLTVLKDETTESREYVFCEDILRSVPIGRCESCSFAGPMAPMSHDGVVDCGRSALPIVNSGVAMFPPAVAAALPVGLALARPVVCAVEHLPWVAVARTPILRDSPGGVP